MQETTLNELSIGDQAIITDFAAAELSFRRKLLALGVMPGAKVCIIRRAPLGDPIQITIRGTSLALRSHEAATIHARPIV